MMTYKNREGGGLIGRRTVVAGMAALGTEPLAAEPDSPVAAFRRSAAEPPVGAPFTRVGRRR